MRAHKRATLIARSIRKLVEDGGGSSRQLAAIEVRLSPEVFGLIHEDGDDVGASELRIEGVLFSSEQRSRRDARIRHQSVPARP